MNSGELGKRDVTRWNKKEGVVSVETNHLWDVDEIAGLPQRERIVWYDDAIDDWLQPQARRRAVLKQYVSVTSL